VWIAVARSLHRFVGDEAGFRRWIFTIARCSLVEAHRKQARRRAATTRHERLENGECSTRHDGDIDPGVVAVERLSAQEAVDAVVALLSPEHAEVVLLRVLAGFDVAEVAAIMGRTPTWVRVMCHRSLRHLRASLPEGAAVR
jgi:RNA polymerase sigma-70 factor (ECF subfamily)